MKDKCNQHQIVDAASLVQDNHNFNKTTEGEVVLDSFAGSGTTIVACEQLQRKGRCMELDPHYCDVIIARWEKMTGKKAVKVE